MLYLLGTQNRILSLALVLSEDLVSLITASHTGAFSTEEASWLCLGHTLGDLSVSIAAMLL